MLLLLALLVYFCPCSSQIISHITVIVNQLYLYVNEDFPSLQDMVLSVRMRLFMLPFSSYLWDNHTCTTCTSIHGYTIYMDILFTCKCIHVVNAHI